MENLLFISKKVLKMRISNIGLLFLIIGIYSCKVRSNESNSISNNSDSHHSPLTINNSLLVQYWYQGKAEVNSYELTQSRYGQLHKGDAVVIFVTEDFNKEKQVKSDDPGAAGENRQAMFKMNMMKRFNTGVYTYNLMLSVFNPIGSKVSPFPLKITSSVQDWCGHVFSQMNQKSDKFVCSNYSYFESEGDQKQELNSGWTEDGLWNQIRINPDLLPLGPANVLPGLFYLRLKHRPQAYLNATLSLVELDKSQKRYQIEYPSENRTLKIDFESALPHKIISWTEIYKEGPDLLTTTATLKKSILLDYWSKHNREDSVWRKELGL